VRVLIVDDSARSRTVLSALLEPLGAILETASSAERAISMILAGAGAKSMPFGLLIIDAQMPTSEGFAVARVALNLPQPPMIMMMVGCSQLHSDAATCREMGIDRYIVKPVSEYELTRALDRLINWSGEIDLPSMPAAQIGLTKVGALSVLLAEDNLVNQKLATRLLEKMGHRVTLASNGAGAVRAHATGRFDVILMDVQMPEMNGFEATANIRARENRSGEHMPIIALTALAVEGDRERCLAAGMDDYLLKPLNAIVLSEKLESIARDRKLAAAAILSASR